MSRLILVRHGRDEGGWADGGDPALHVVGRAQAEAAADALAPLGPLPIIVSPLRRARETAAALERRWAATATVEPGVGEVLTPEGVDDRAAWLRDLMAGSWADAGPSLRAWRDSVVSTLLGVEGDAVVVSHFVAINVAVGAATGSDRVVCFRPDNCCRTVLDVDDGELRLVDLGDQAGRTVVR